MEPLAAWGISLSPNRRSTLVNVVSSHLVSEYIVNDCVQVCLPTYPRHQRESVDDAKVLHLKHEVRVVCY